MKRVFKVPCSRTARLFSMLLVLALFTGPVRIPAQAESPASYNANDCERLVSFFSQPSAVAGKTNGQILCESTGAAYSPIRPDQWAGVKWEPANSGGPVRVTDISWRDKQLAGCLDIGGMTALKRVNCNNNRLTELKIEQTQLTDLACSSNLLTSLDVGGQAALITLDCSINQITALDISDCRALFSLNCSMNRLASLDTQSNSQLAYLSCGYNQLTELDISRNTALLSFSCYNNQFVSLSAEKNTDLTELNCDGNRLASLDVTKNTKLTRLQCSDNRLGTINLLQNSALQNLHCSSNQIMSLDVSRNTDLRTLHCASNVLVWLDISHNPSLSDLDCSFNQLTEPPIFCNGKPPAKMICQGNPYLANPPLMIHPPSDQGTSGEGGIYDPDQPMPFTDTQGHWAEWDIRFAVQNDLFSGVSETSFCPDRSMSRAMFVTVLGRLAEIVPSQYNRSEFSDVNPDSWYGPYVIWAAEAGIASGTGQGCFSPDRPVTREQMAVLLFQFIVQYRIHIPPTIDKGTFTDLSEVSPWARDSVFTLQKMGILSGKKDGRFCPSELLTRAQAAALFRTVYTMKHS